MDKALVISPVKPQFVTPGAPSLELATAVQEALGERRRSNGRDRVRPLGEPEVARRLREIYESVAEKELR